MDEIAREHIKLSALLVDAIEHPLKRTFIQDSEWTTLPGVESGIRKSLKDLESKKKSFEKAKAKSKQKGKQDKNLADYKSAFETKKLQVAAESMSHIERFEGMDKRRAEATRMCMFLRYLHHALF